MVYLVVITDRNEACAPPIIAAYDTKTEADVNRQAAADLTIHGGEWCKDMYTDVDVRMIEVDMNSNITKTLKEQQNERIAASKKSDEQYALRREKELAEAQKISDVLEKEGISLEQIEKMKFINMKYSDNGRYFG